MSTNDARTALEREFAESVNDLQAALEQAADANHQAAQANTDAAKATTQAAEATSLAADAAVRVQSLLPRVGSISNLFAELDSVIRSGREQVGDGAQAPVQTYTRPTLVVPEDSPAAVAVAIAAGEAAAKDAAFEPANSASLTSFRLEFESNPGPLDLRTVDDAVSEHPAVRDVALLDYDGRKATLKVWIEPSATPSDIQAALAEKSPQLFANGNDVTIVALEDVA